MTALGRLRSFVTVCDFRALRPVNLRSTAGFGQQRSFAKSRDGLDPGTERSVMCWQRKPASWPRTAPAGGQQGGGAQEHHAGGAIEEPGAAGMLQPVLGS